MELITSQLSSSYRGSDDSDHAVELVQPEEGRGRNSD